MIFFVLWLVVAVLALYPLSNTVGKLFMDGDDPSDRWFSIFLACIAALAWPIVLGVLVAYRSSRGVWTRFKPETGDER